MEFIFFIIHEITRWVFDQNYIMDKKDDDVPF